MNEGDDLEIDGDPPERRATGRFILDGLLQMSETLARRD